MLILSGNQSISQFRSNVNTSNLVNTPIENKSMALNSSIISRIHNVKPGCGSCGRK
jgi:hypothetical protein